MRRSLFIGVLLLGIFVRASAVFADIFACVRACFFVIRFGKVVIVIRMSFVNVFFDYSALFAFFVSYNGDKLGGAFLVLRFEPQNVVIKH